MATTEHGLRTPGWLREEDCDVNELRTRAINWADALAGRSRESAWIGTLHEGHVLVIHHVFRPDDSLQTLQVGTYLPTHASARYDTPPRRLEDDPIYLTHPADFAEYHTRYVTPDAARDALRRRADIR